MRLLVDCGNSRIKWGLATADVIVERGQTAFRDDFEAALEALKPYAARELESIEIASVLSEPLTRRLAGSLAAAGAAVRLVSTRAEGYGLRVAYADPAALGVDRWLAMVAGHALRPGAPFCVVSAGTAVTFDAVAADGTHLGGLIWPGPRLAAAALAAGTDRIGPTGDPGPMPQGRDLLGSDTASAVGRGSLLALAAGIDRAARMVAGPGAIEAELLLTGGDAGRLATWLETPAVIEPDLVLEGLRIVANSAVGADA